VHCTACSIFESVLEVQVLVQTRKLGRGSICGGLYQFRSFPIRMGSEVYFVAMQAEELPDSRRSLTVCFANLLLSMLEC
jgi:hypothetical protein